MVEIAAVAVSFFGVVLVSDPLHAAALVVTSRLTYIVGCVLALLAVVVAAAICTTLRSIAARIHCMTSVLSLGSCLVIIGLVGGGGSPRELGRNPNDTALSYVLDINIAVRELERLFAISIYQSSLSYLLCFYPKYHVLLALWEHRLS